LWFLDDLEIHNFVCSAIDKYYDTFFCSLAVTPRAIESDDRIWEHFLAVFLADLEPVGLDWTINVF
jgi:hypothetical protein